MLPAPVARAAPMEIAAVSVPVPVPAAATRAVVPVHIVAKRSCCPSSSHAPLVLHFFSLLHFYRNVLWARRGWLVACIIHQR